MKIVLPKTIAEPLTIGWPTPYGHGQIPEWIIAELRAAFERLENAQRLPSYGDKCLSIQDVCAYLRVITERRGAESISTSCINIHRKTQWVGYLFIVHFSEPGKSQRYGVRLKTYF